jgi:hypothetical protein
MSLPSGKIIARPMVVRACGHEQEFQHYERDRFRDQRLAKFQATRCTDCVNKLNAAQKQASGIPKHEALKRLPTGTQLSLTLAPDNAWTGTLSANGTTVNAVGIAGAGPQSVAGSLAQLWLAEAEKPTT